MFRQLAASSLKVDWAKINSSIYTVTFLAQSGKGRMCQLCLEADHGAKDCALASGAAPRTAPANALQPPLTPRRGPVKRRSDQYCRYHHVSSRCQGSHHNWQCRVVPAVVGPPYGGPTSS